MKWNKKRLINLLAATSLVVVTTPILASTIVSCGSSKNTSTQSNDLDKLRKLKAPKNDWTPYIPNGKLYKRNDAGQEVSLNEYHWYLSERGARTNNFLYNIVYSPSRDELGAAILGPGETGCEYDGKLQTPTKLDQYVNLQGVYYYQKNEQSGLLEPSTKIAVKVFGDATPTRDEEAIMREKKLWIFSNRNPARFAPFEGNELVLDFSDSLIESCLSLGYEKSIEKPEMFPNVHSVKVLLPATLENARLDLRNILNFRFAKKIINKCLYDFSRCTKIESFADDTICSIATEIILPPNLKKIENGGIKIDFDQIQNYSPENKLNLNIIGLEHVQLFQGGAIGSYMYDKYISPIYIDFKPTTYYVEFPEWMNITGGQKISSAMAK